MRRNKTSRVLKEIFKPPCFGKFPWDEAAQEDRLCKDCSYVKNCFKMIKRKAKANWDIYQKVSKEGLETKEEEKEIREILKNVGFAKDEIDDYLKKIKKEARLNPLFVRD